MKAGRVVRGCGSFLATVNRIAEILFGYSVRASEVISCLRINLVLVLMTDPETYSKVLKS